MWWRRIFSEYFLYWLFWINSFFFHSSFASFTWTDGKLNSSNILILSGPAVAHFDLEFRILHSRSKPINLNEFSSCKKNRVWDQLFRITVASRDVTKEHFLRMEFLYLRAFVGDLKRKRSWLHASREAVYTPNNTMHTSPPLTKRNGSLVMRPHWIIERWTACPRRARSRTSGTTSIHPCPALSCSVFVRAAGKETSDQEKVKLELWLCLKNTIKPLLTSTVLLNFHFSTCSCMF